MQTREELCQKGHDKSKNDVLREVDKYHFHKGGINIVFRSKYRPLPYLLVILELVKVFPNCPNFANVAGNRSNFVDILQC
jgi:hypothetical protein